MEKNIIWGIPAIFLCSSILSSCEKNNTKDLPGDPVEISTEVYQKEIIDSANRFAFDLFLPALNEAAGEENIMISPFSVTSALSMTLNGASGSTFEAIRSTLGLKDKTLQQINETYLKLMTEMIPVDERVIVEIANSVWVEKRLTVKQPFITALQTWYKAEARDIDVTDPGAVGMVNGWIADKTHDKIRDMLSDLDPDLAMLLINAVYFNGKWKFEFDKAKTTQDPFFAPSGSKTVPMMHQTTNLQTSKKDDVTLVELPYGQGNYTMMVVLPDEGTSVSEVASELTPALWKEWTNQLTENGVHEVELSMPRFKYDYKRLLNSDLSSLGMSVAFTPMADFNNISDQDLAISRVLHQTFIETNEEGTEAAAATVVEMFTTSMPVTMPVKIDRPFLYFIREGSTGTILFMGYVNDPAIN